MKIETMHEAGSYKWGYMVNGMLAELGWATEQGAENAAMQAYPDEVVLTTESPEHYSNK